MVKATDFELASIQAAIFTPSWFKPTIIMDKIWSNWRNYFDAMPISLPAPPDIPAEIPRIILQSQSHNYKLEMAPARANVFWFRQKDDDKISLDDFLRFCSKLLGEYLNMASGKVNRLAVVLNRFVKHDSPGITLAQHFCKEKWLIAALNRPENFELHAHKRYELATKYHINSWFRCKTGFVRYDPKQPIILVEQDLNTIIKEIEFSIDDIRNFYSLVPDEFDKILSVYFPEEGIS